MFSGSPAGYSKSNMTRRTLLGGAAGGLLYAANDEPLRVCLAGLAHGHARGFFSRNLARPDLKVLGVSEADSALRTKYLTDFKLDAGIGFDSVESMLAKVKPEVVLLFTNTFDHLAAVQDVREEQDSGGDGKASCGQQRSCEANADRRISRRHSGAGQL